MGHSQADKALSHDRILKEAASQIRDSGLESLSVATLMRSAKLTHGAFYAHFASRADLLAHALERALVDGRAASKAATESQRATSHHAFVRGYLSRAHRDARKEGCAIAALASDVARADQGPREVMTPHIESLIAKMASGLEGDEDEALVAVSAMVGGLLLSRVVADPKRSDAILRAVKNSLTARKEPPASTPDGVCGVGGRR